MPKLTQPVHDGAGIWTRYAPLLSYSSGYLCEDSCDWRNWRNLWQTWQRARVGGRRIWNEQPPSLSVKNLKFSLETSYLTMGTFCETSGFMVNIIYLNCKILSSWKTVPDLFSDWSSAPCPVSHSSWKLWAMAGTWLWEYHYFTRHWGSLQCPSSWDEECTTHSSPRPAFSLSIYYYRFPKST